MAYTFVRTFVPLAAFTGLGDGQALKVANIPPGGRFLGKATQLEPPGLWVEYEYEDASLPPTTVSVGLQGGEDG